MYVDGTRVVRRSPAGRTETVAKLPSPDVVASRATPHLAYVTGAPSPDDDFLVDPVLHVLDPTTGEDVEAGAGVSPLWAPDGARVAYLQPAGDRRCEGEVCSGEARVATVDTATGSLRTVLPPGRWTLLAWAGDVLLVADARAIDRTVTVDAAGRRGSLPVAPSELWDASPDGRWLVVARPGAAAFVPLDDGRVSGPPRRVPLAGRVLADGAWAPDSSRLAAVLLDPSGARRSRLAILDPESSRPAPVRGTAGASSSVLWSRSGAEVAFAAEAGAHLEARVCRVDGGPCRRGPSWTSGVRLLRLE